MPRKNSTICQAMNKRNWLKITSDIFFAGCILGTILTSITQEVIFVAVPLTITMGLNLILRQQLTQFYQLQIVELEKRRKQEIEQLKLSLAEVNQVLQLLNSNLPQFQQETQREIEQLKLSLTEVNQVNQKISTEIRNKVGSETEIKQIEEALFQINEFQEIVEPISEKLPQLEARIEQKELREAIVNEIINPINQRLAYIDKLTQLLKRFALLLLDKIESI